MVFALSIVVLVLSLVYLALVLGRYEFKRDVSVAVPENVGMVPIDIRPDAPIDEVVSELSSFRVSSYDINTHDREEVFRFYSTYLESLTKFVQLARKSLLIVDYISHGKALDEIIKDDAYGERILDMYRAYFKSLEDLLQTYPDLTYRRIIQLPVDDKLSELDERGGVVPAMSHPLARVATDSFILSIEHLRRMESNPRFDLYILSRPIRLYSFVIVDEMYMLCEYDRYLAKGMVPDLAYLDFGGPENPKVQKVIDIQVKLVESAMEKLEPIKREAFVEATNDVADWGQLEKGKVNRTVRERIRETLRDLIDEA